mmetsp:Transcript_114416/g.180140  ORF Transcript_114416/g.180140 Transcript_114416/m.180140 type:complete len:219 (+) Transcript_114416:925-1581(+)
MPTPQVSRRSERPPQKWYGVVKPEHTIVVLDIIFVEQRIDFHALRVVVDITSTPLESIRKRIWLIPDICWCLNGINGTAVARRYVLRSYRRNRLRIPERVRALNLSPRLLANTGRSQHLQQLLLTGRRNITTLLLVIVFVCRTFTTFVFLFLLFLVLILLIFYFFFIFLLLFLLGIAVLVNLLNFWHCSVCRTESTKGKPCHLIRSMKCTKFEGSART